MAGHLPSFGFEFLTWVTITFFSPLWFSPSHWLWLRLKSDCQVWNMSKIWVCALRSPYLPTSLQTFHFKFTLECFTECPQDILRCRCVRSLSSFATTVINPRRDCAARVTVLGLCVCVCVCYTTFHAIIRASNDTNLLSDGWRSKF